MDSPRVLPNQQDAVQEHILVKLRLTPALELYRSNKMKMRAIPRLFVLNVQTQPEAQSNMTTGILSRPEIVEQLWLEPLKEQLILM
jgi:hypothetical protein